MRISAIVKQYISEQITKIYDIKYEALRDKKKALRDKNDILKQEITTKIKECAKKIVEDSGCKLSFEKDMGWRYSTDTSLNGFCYSTPLDIAIAEINKEISAIEIEQSKALQNIIVTLELGGNKSDLERLLKELAETVNN